MISGLHKIICCLTVAAAFVFSVYAPAVAGSPAETPPLLLQQNAGSAGAPASSSGRVPAADSRKTHGYKLQTVADSASARHSLHGRHALHAGLPVTITDDTGHTVQLQAPAQRIIALYGAFNEILTEMGLQDRLVARTNADNWPPAITALPAIGTHMRPNLELVAGLAPDLVLQMSGRKEAQQAVAELRAMNIPVAEFHAGSFEQLFSVITRLGVLTGTPQKAAHLNGNLQQRLEAVQTAVADQPQPTVFFEVRYPNLLGAGQASIVNDIIRFAGGTNCLQADKKLDRPSEEELLRLNPDVYIVQHGPMNKVPVPLTDRPHYRPLRAVQANRWMIVEEAQFSRPGPRAVTAVEELARYLHPSRFAPAPAVTGQGDS
ncbi:ABC transporter substrate-binding protein [Oleidesulfovibrio sp.]|uniref:ABC transporter substrate-binding protein n=1 Tax=Oleidesulfovibrio sp. TaxID=2909707 RepID=UPI003A875B07